MIWGQIACGASGISADCVPGVALAPRGSSLSVGCSVSADSLLSMSFIFCFFYLNILGLLVSLDGQDHHPPALITPGPGTRQPGAAPVSQSPLKVFKWINPKPVYPLSPVPYPGRRMKSFVHVVLILLLPPDQLCCSLCDLPWRGITQWYGIPPT